MESFPIFLGASSWVKSETGLINFGSHENLLVKKKLSNSGHLLATVLGLLAAVLSLLATVLWLLETVLWAVRLQLIQSNYNSFRLQ